MQIIRNILNYVTVRSLLTFVILLILLHGLLQEIKYTNTFLLTISQNGIRLFYMRKQDILKSPMEKYFPSTVTIDFEKIAVLGIKEQANPKYVPDERRFLEFFDRHGYNALLSDYISLNRSLPDIRHTDCKARAYSESLQPVSIIIPIHNEHWSTLLRTLYSVLSRSPDHLIKEILLVDDASSKEFFNEKLDQFINNRLPKVKVIRLANRSGVVTARLTGAKRATADVLIFLDARTEVNVHWLQPLLEPISKDTRMAVEPVVDVIAYDTLEYRVRDNGAQGVFDWSLTYRRIPLALSNEEHLPEPFKTPVMFGGAFAISRNFFWELGGYDPDLLNGGGEQYDISFKIWMCGGQLLQAPCSRVGYIYRDRNLDDANTKDHSAWNIRRVSEVWMDEYAEYVRPEQRDIIDPGDITQQKALRQKLNCKTFKWYMTEVASDLPRYFSRQDSIRYAEGQIRSSVNPNLCVEGNFGINNRFMLKKCLPLKEKESKNHSDRHVKEQIFIMTLFMDVKFKYRPLCWDIQHSIHGAVLTMNRCHHSGGSQMWKYDKKTKHFINNDMDPAFCLDYNPKELNYLVLNPCNIQSKTQSWEVDAVFEEQMAKLNSLNGLPNFFERN